MRKYSKRTNNVSVFVRNPIAMQLKRSGDLCMYRTRFILFSGIILLAACNDIKKPNSTNLTKAINQSLQRHGDLCTPLGQPLPTDIPQSEQQDQYGIFPELTTLEKAGLVHSSATIATTPGIFGLGAPRPVRRYEMTEMGRRYYRLTPGTFGPSGAFCYGQKSVDSIVKWTEPVTAGSASQTQVTYTYNLVHVAPWAERPDVQRVFPDIRMAISGASTASQVAGLQLTNQGWAVPEQ